jgi:phage terminase large subunit
MPTTLKTLLEEILDPLRDELHARVYEHKQTRSTIALEGGGEIYYFGFDEETKLGSLAFGAVGIDEATEIDEKEYDMLLGRLRKPVDPNPQLFGACNPSGPAHFLYHKFFEENKPTRKLIHTQSSDNVFLPETYRTILDGFTGQARARYVDGQWVAFEGLVYDRWDRDIYVRERKDIFPWTICGVDDGYTNPFAASLWGMDADGRLHLMQEVYRSGLLPATKIEILREIEANLYVVDPSAASLIGDMRAAGLNARPGDNAVQDGILCVQDLFTIPGDGIPRFTVSPECVSFIREVESYAWMKGKDKPEPVMNHLMDSWRYLVKWIHDNWRYAPGIATAIIHQGRGDGTFAI